MIYDITLCGAHLRFWLKIKHKVSLFKVSLLHSHSPFKYSQTSIMWCVTFYPRGVRHLCDIFVLLDFVFAAKYFEGVLF